MAKEDLIQMMPTRYIQCCTTMVTDTSPQLRCHHEIRHWRILSERQLRPQCGPLSKEQRKSGSRPIVKPEPNGPLLPFGR